MRAKYPSRDTSHDLLEGEPEPENRPPLHALRSEHEQEHLEGFDDSPHVEEREDPSEQVRVGLLAREVLVLRSQGQGRREWESYGLCKSPCDRSASHTTCVIFAYGGAGDLRGEDEHGEVAHDEGADREGPREPELHGVPPLAPRARDRAREAREILA